MSGNTVSLRVPSSTSAWTRATSAGVTPSDAMSVSVSLARRASSPSHHFRAACGLAPAAIVSSTSPRAPAPIVSRISRSENPQSAWRRTRFSCGGSGSSDLSCSTQAASGAIGTRSGSGK